MMLNIMALVFNRLPERAPFFIKPLLRTISKKAEQGISVEVLMTKTSILRSPAEAESSIHRI